MLPEFKYGSYILKNPKEQEKLCEELMSLDGSSTINHIKLYASENFNEVRINIAGHKVTSHSGLLYGSYMGDGFGCVNGEPIDLIDYLKKNRNPPKCLRRL